jgi:hypothetical protein
MIITSTRLHRLDARDRALFLRWAIDAAGSRRPRRSWTVLTHAGGATKYHRRVAGSVVGRSIGGLIVSVDAPPDHGFRNSFLCARGESPPPTRQFHHALQVDDHSFDRLTARPRGIDIGAHGLSQRLGLDLASIAERGAEQRRELIACSARCWELVFGFRGAFVH